MIYKNKTIKCFNKINEQTFKIDFNFIQNVSFYFI